MGTFAYHATTPRVSAITGHEVVDYGLEKTKDVELAWIVFEKDESKEYNSLYIYSHFERRKRPLYAKELFNPLITLIPEL